MLGSFSGGILPRPVTASSGNMFVTFSSDSSVESSGFIATFSNVAPTPLPSFLPTTSPTPLPSPSPTIDPTAPPTEPGTTPAKTPVPIAAAKTPAPTVAAKTPAPIPPKTPAPVAAPKTPAPVAAPKTPTPAQIDPTVVVYVTVSGNIVDFSSSALLAIKSALASEIGVSETLIQVTVYAAGSVVLRVTVPASSVPTLTQKQGTPLSAGPLGSIIVESVSTFVPTPVSPPENSTTPLDSPLIIIVDSVPCSTATWVSSTSIVCAQSGGWRSATSAVPYSVNVSGLHTNGSTEFTFDGMRFPGYRASMVLIREIFLLHGLSTFDFVQLRLSHPSFHQ